MGYATLPVIGSIWNLFFIGIGLVVTAVVPHMVAGVLMLIALATVVNPFLMEDITFSTIPWGNFVAALLLVGLAAWVGSPND